MTPNVKFYYQYVIKGATSYTDGQQKPKPTDVIVYGPGGSYLSNEIFYRVAKLGEENVDKKGKLFTGHFHIAKLQNEKIKKISLDKTKELLNIVRDAIKNALI